jgi:hypothetical protein
VRISDVQSRLRIGLTTVLVDEYGLLVASRATSPPSERALAAQLAFRLRSLFEASWDVDVEYNRTRHGIETDVKRSLLTPPECEAEDARRARRAAAVDGRDGQQPPRPVRTETARTADLIVHRRGATSATHNLLLLELKVTGGHDEHELARLAHLEHAHQYEHAVLLDLALEWHAGSTLPR